jgi:type VI protein secretion system component VasK
MATDSESAKGPGSARVWGSAKVRLVLAGVAVVCAVVGVIVLAVALVFALRWVVPWPIALALTALAFLTVAGVCLWFGLRPQVGLDEEAQELVETLSGLATDVPVEALRRMIVERPLAAVALASSAGALLARRPQLVGQLLEKLLVRLV